MKRALFLVVALGLAFLEGQATSGELSVIDGDGLRVGGESVRLWGIDAPELDQQCQRNGTPYACGAEAYKALRSLIQEGELSCKTVDRDRYGRMVARCAVAGKDVGASLVSAGWALDYERYSGGAYAREEREARLAKRGLWAGEFDLPWLWRRTH